MDFDPFLTRATSFGVMMLTDVKGNTFQVDSLQFPGWARRCPATSPR
ncbi:hypothetical protein LT493_34060 [Streptomyces tricolor]|nr:hypothetical protein [Streptomyces tricolor]